MWPRFALWTLLSFAANYLHSLIALRIVRTLPGEILPEIYARVAATVLLTFTLGGLGGLVVCYYYSLRQRRVHTALTEAGLAVRAVLAGLLAMLAFSAAVWMYLSGFDRGT